MDKKHLGEFEELVLLTVAALQGEGYGVSVCQEIGARTGRTVQLSAVHIALYRLQEKGLVNSHVGGATAERGGRSKRIFTITASGMKALKGIKDVREDLYRLIPKLA